MTDDVLWIMNGGIWMMGDGYGMRDYGAWMMVMGDGRWMRDAG